MKTEIFVKIIIYSLYICGTLLFLKERIHITVKRIVLRHRLSGGGRKLRSRSYYHRLLSSSFEKEEGSLLFTGSQILAFVLTFVTGTRSLRLLPALLLSAAASVLPLILLIISAENKRIKGSKEGIELVTEIYRQYILGNQNIYEALNAACMDISKYPICGKLTAKLLLRLRSAGSIGEIRESLDNFSFSIGTSWAGMLSVCIRQAAESGRDVSPGLEDIIRSLKTATELSENRKRLNSEAVRMAVFLPPFLYVGTVIMSNLFLGLDLLTFAKNQFMTKAGLLMFFIIIFLFIFNITLIRFVVDRKLDY